MVLTVLEVLTEHRLRNIAEANGDGRARRNIDIVALISIWNQFSFFRFPNVVDEATGVDFTNVLRIAFMRADLRGAKMTVKSSVILSFWDLCA